MLERLAEIAPKKYFPIQKNRYEVVAGFKNISRSECRFEIDREFLRYRSTKLASRGESLEKYYPPTSRLAESELSAVAKFIAMNLAGGYPDFFDLREARAGYELDCKLTDERLVFHVDFRLDHTRTRANVQPGYRDALDALACQVQEDLAIWKASDPQVESEWLAAVHLCFPNHWAAGEKIGKSFNAVHAPVAHFDVLSHGARKIVQFITQSGDVERFAWGVATDDRLNHHPIPSVSADAQEWAGRAFSLSDPMLFLRFERQTLTAFPEICASLFTIRTYFTDVSAMNPSELESLAQAVESMSDKSLEYKGLSRTKADVVNWIRSLVSE